MEPYADPHSALLRQVEFCRRNGAPITARICQALHDVLDRTSMTGARLLDWQGHALADAVPLRAAGAFHALYRAGRCAALVPVYRGAVEDAGPAVRAAIAEHDAEIATWLDGPPQTNEPARSAVLMAGLLALASRFGTRFELLEIGSSAGLNLLIDRYGFDLGGVKVGPTEAPILLTPEWRGPPPPTAPVEIDSVRGVDIAPFDLDAPGAAERLTAYVWADNADRLERIERAIALARVVRPRLEQGDAADWVEARLAEPQRDGVARVLMHSIVWQYLPPEGQARIEAAMNAAGARATAERPLGWIGYELMGGMMSHGLQLRAWPGGGAPEPLATAHPHGAWIEWLGGEAQG